MKNIIVKVYQKIKSSMKNHRIFSILIVTTIFLCLLYMFYWEFPISFIIDKKEPLLYYIDETGKYEYKGEEYIRISPNINDYYKNIENKKLQIKFDKCFFKLKESMNSKEIFFKRYKTLSDIKGMFHCFLLNENIIVCVYEEDNLSYETAEFICLKSDSIIPEFKAENIESIEIYRGEMPNKASNKKQYYDNVRSLMYEARTGKPYNNFISMVEKKVDSSFINNFVDELNKNGNILSLYNEFSQKYKEENILFAVNFKDKNFPFSLLFAE